MSKRRARPVGSDDENEASQVKGTPTPNGRSRTTRGRRAVDESEEVGEESEDSSHETRSRKRARKDRANPTPNGHGRGRGRPSTQAQNTDDEEEESEVEADGCAKQAPDQEVVRKRHPDGFLPGSIVRLRAINFMTYDDVEFLFGPHLNMIIGPNGTGKSSLICALALGLGYGTSVLQRANELKFFVKNNTSRGSVEIELKGNHGRNNVVIKVHFNLDTNSRVFEVDGSKSTLTKVTEIVRSFHIQVDNLCCFLPQEKVGQFAAMNPVFLLRATQKAAGHPLLTQWHDILIEKGARKITIDAKLEELQGQEQQLNKQLQNMKKDVDILEERVQRQDTIKMLDLAVRHMQYLALKKEHLEQKAKVAEIEKDLISMEEARKPLTDQIEVFDDAKKVYKQSNQKLDATNKQLQKVIKQRSEAFKTAESSHGTALNTLLDLRNSERKRKEQLGKLKRELEDLVELTREPVEEADSSDLTAQLALVSTEARAVMANVTHTDVAMREAYNAQRSLKDGHSRICNQIDQLKSVAFRKEHALKQNLTSVYKALGILRKLQAEGRFQGKVFEPVQLMISPKEARYAAVIENCIGFNRLNTFVCTDEVDYNLFLTECNDVQRLRVNVARLPAGDCLANFQPVLGRERLVDFGFDHYVIDLINGPDEILAFLCRMQSLHQIFKLSASANAIVLSELGLSDTPPTPSHFPTTDPDLQACNRLLSGHRELSTPRPAISKLDAERCANEEKDAERQEELERLKIDEIRYREEFETLKKQKAQLQEDIKSMKAAHVKYLERLNLRKRKEGEYERAKAQPSTDERKAVLQGKLKKACLEYMEKAVDYQDSYCQRARLTTKTITYQIRETQLEGDATHFGDVCQQSNAELKKCQRRYDEAIALKSELSTRALSIHTPLREDVNNAGPEIMARIKQLHAETKSNGEHYTQDDLAALRDREQERLDLTNPVDEGVLTRYKDLNGRVEALRTTITGWEETLSKVQRKIATVYNNWKPHLDALIKQVDGKFDAIFKEMDCLGHVKIEEDPDYAKWGIGIELSFRANERMSHLTAHVQSGGERSLATVMYLMSLTELAKTPFCAVDEINQGLDMRVERLVHNRVVKSTCREAASQYFLITPKLLLDLDYHPLMRVLCINNGHWLPNDFKIGNYLAQAKIKAEAKRRAIRQ